jgi:hypothetical protein
LDLGFLDVISKLRVYGEIGASGELYLQQNFGMNYLSDCMIIKMNDDLEKVKDGVPMRLTKKNGALVSGKDQLAKKNSGDGALELAEGAGMNWVEDKINPCSEPLKLDLFVDFMLLENFNIWFLEREAFILNTVDSSVFVSSQDCEFLSHVKPCFYQNTLSYDIKLYNTKILPPTLRSYNLWTSTLEYEIPLSELKQFFTRACSSNILNFETLLQKNFILDQKTEKTLFQKTQKFSESNSGPTSIIAQTETEEGTCEAYNDGTVKIKFRDRTLIWFYGNLGSVKLVSHMGDY